MKSPSPAETADFSSILANRSGTSASKPHIRIATPPRTDAQAPYPKTPKTPPGRLPFRACTPGSEGVFSYHLKETDSAGRESHRTIMRRLIPLLLLAAPLLAQSNEIGLQFGRTVSEGRRFQFDGFPNNVFKEDSGYAGGFVYNRKLAGGDGVALNFHLPLFVFENKVPGGAFNQDAFRDTSSATAFVTPGVQIRFLQPFFLQPYVFAGVGYAHVARLTPRNGVDGVDFENQGTWGVSAGGGVDVVFGRHFGVRGEIRSLTAGGRDRVIPGLTLDDPSTRWAATGGVLFRF